ncbi:hypothetical protein [Sulfitobacter sp. 1A12157]|uniref:hypothetical protein n=1 Tax=Sulfitobacter sp. 1A12157 TaxID=3368594 RepID=UPI003745E6C6
MTEQERVEKVAKVMAEAVNDTSTHDPTIWGEYEDMARAAIAALAITPQEAAKVLLAAVDAFMSGEKLTEEQRELERTAVIAGAFAGGAYDRYWPKGGGEYHALTRAFLLALIDPDHAELDYLRADPSAGQTARDARAALRAISEDSHE